VARERDRQRSSTAVERNAVDVWACGRLLIGYDTAGRHALTL